MKKQFVNYEIAFALKELGFNEECFGWYYLNNPDYIEYERCKLKDCTDIHISAPLWQQAIDWFEKRYIYISFFKVSTGSDEWEIAYSIEYLPKETWMIKRRALSFERIDSFKDGLSSYSGAWHTSSEAREAAILEAIKIVKGEPK